MKRPELVMDRCTHTVFGKPVQFCRLREPVAGGYVFAGRVQGGHLELWRDNGRWREDETGHPLDLVLVAQRGAA